MSRGVTAVVLAGGLGTRLRPVVADRPKVMAEIHGRPFLSYLLDQLVVAGFRNAVLCVGYLGEQVRFFFGTSYSLLTLTYSQEQSLLGTGGALRLALPLIESDPVLVLNGDSFCEADLRGFSDWHSQRSAVATILLTEVADTARYGRIKVNADGEVVGFEEKGGSRGPGQINAGMYLLNRSLIEDIPSGNIISLERQVFPSLVGRGLYAYHGSSRFLDIGVPESYAAAEEFFAAR